MTALFDKVWVDENIKALPTEAGVNVDVEYRLCPMRPGSMHI